MSLGRPVIRNSFMEEEMKDHAISEAQIALERCNSERFVASFMKQSFEQKYKSVWHCIVGRNFGGFVTHEQGRYIYFYIGQKGFVIFSTS